MLAACLLCVASANALAGADMPHLMGQGTLRWLGLKIYDARLLSAGPLDGSKIFESTFALELTYARKLYGNLIAERSLEEMKKQGLGTPQQHEAWLGLMKKAFPDVAANDQLKGVHRPGMGADFYFNGNLIHSIADPDFSRAFFSIWLSPKTTEPGLRRALLGSSGGS